MDLADGMVRSQIENRGVKDPLVLGAMRKVVRSRFVPESSKRDAYSDEPQSIGYGQTISQPYIVAHMTEVLEIQPCDRVLEIGTGSGYQSAVLAELAKEVFTIEKIKNLSDSAQRVLSELGYSNIYFHVSDGWHGWKEKAPFDKIIVTAAAKRVPADLVSQLKEGGRMIIPVGETNQKLVLGEKKDGFFQTTEGIAVRFVPLVEAEEKN